MPRRAGWILAAIAVLVLVLGVAIVPGLIHRQILALGATDIHDVGSLPAEISVCGREWHRSASEAGLTGAEARSHFGGQLPLVDPLPFAPCPVGPCTATGSGPCDTVVLVRIGEDRYVDYALSGGP